MLIKIFIKVNFISPHNLYKYLEYIGLILCTFFIIMDLDIHLNNRRTQRSRRHRQYAAALKFIFGL